ncbi:MAG: hypothetical protein ACOYK9_00595 [Chlamydiia bacterium]
MIKLPTLEIIFEDEIHASAPRPSSFRSSVIVKGGDRIELTKEILEICFKRVDFNKPGKVEALYKKIKNQTYNIDRKLVKFFCEKSEIPYRNELIQGFEAGCLSLLSEVLKPYERGKQIGYTHLVDQMEWAYTKQKMNKFKWKNGLTEFQANYLKEGVCQGMKIESKEQIEPVTRKPKKRFTLKISPTIRNDKKGLPR